MKRSGPRSPEPVQPPRGCQPAYPPAGQAPQPAGYNSKSQYGQPRQAAPSQYSPEIAQQGGFTPPPMAEPQMAPLTAVWAPPVAAVAGCPIGLEYLTVLDTVIVEKLVKIPKAMMGIETPNQYILRNGLGQQIYYAFEVSTRFARTFVGKDRPFTIVLTNNFQQQVCRIHRPHAIFGGSRCMVESPLGVNIGYISQLGSGFLCCDAIGQPFFQILTPMFAMGTHPFQVVSIGTMQPIGQIVKHYGDTWKEMYTDTFSCHFPIELNAQMKAVLVAAVFLIDFHYFEDTANDRKNVFR